MVGQHSIWLWVFFYVFVVGIPLVIDLFVAHKKGEKDTTAKAIKYSLFWIAYALAFGVYIWQFHGTEAATQYYTGYIIEKLLSADNLAMFVLIFSAFCIKAEHQHRILFWGVLGAFLIRGVFIFTGNALISHFEFLVYIFALMLIAGAWKMIKGEEEKSDEEKKKELEEQSYMKWLKAHLPLTTRDHGSKFFVKERQDDGSYRRMFTQLFLVLCCVEITDVIFAVDSIPAILVISKDPFILITSNVMAILGLRSLYFVLSSVLEKFHLLKYGIAAILAIVGLKMLEFGFAPVKYLLEVGEHYGPYVQAHWAMFALVIGVAFAVSYFGSRLKVNGLIQFAFKWTPLFGALIAIKYLVKSWPELAAWDFGITHHIPEIHVPAVVSFSIVIGLLTSSVVLSLIFPKKVEPKAVENAEGGEEKTGA